MTKKILIMVSVVMLIALVGCSQEMVEVTTTTKPSTTVAATTTTQKQTTTKKVTTTTSDCKGNNDHWMPSGNVGKWYSSKQAFMNGYNSRVDYWNDKLDNDEISYEEYIKQVPRGYEIWQFAECGKWTGNYKYK